MTESLLHSAFRYNDFALIERLRHRPGYEESLLEKNSEGETCLDIAFFRGTGILFIPANEILERISKASGNIELVLRPFLERGQGDFPWDALSCNWPKELLEDLIRTAIRIGSSDHIPFKLLAGNEDWHAYAVLKKIKSKDLSTLPDNLCRPDLWSRPTDFGSLYHAAAKQGILQKIPRGLLTPESLLLRDSKGKTPVHILASSRSGSALDALFRKISWAFDCQIQDNAGNTILHEAAMAGVLSSLPSDSLTSATMSLARKDGLNPVDLAYENRHMDSVPEGFRYLSAPYRKDRLIGALLSGRWTGIPERLLEPEIVTKIVGSLLPIDSTYLHIAARSGNLHSVPQTLIDCEPLRTRDKEDNTPLHLAASVGKLHYLPSKRLDPEVLIMQNKSGLNVVDLAYKSDELSFFDISIQRLSPLFRKTRLLDVIRSTGAPEVKIFTSEDLLATPYPSSNHATFAHWLASEQRLLEFPSEIIDESVLGNQDADGNTPLHLLASTGSLEKLSRDILCRSLLLIPNHQGVTSFHLVAARKGISGISISLFNREALLTKDKQGRSVADVVEEHGNTPLLPPDLRNFSKARALERLQECFSRDYISAARKHTDEFADLVTLDKFKLLGVEFVQEWAGDDDDWKLDEEQADAVADYGPHIQVVARAGSGKTRTLVARTLFQITHCRIPASSILILAFNKKAVAEIRERLGKRLNEEQMPHVLTFHALAHRIVKPHEDLIYDEGDSKEGQVFSTIIQRIIDEQTRGGPFEAKLRELMEARWRANLRRIIEMGFNLEQEEFLTHRVNLPETTMNGRRVDTEAHKHIGNALLRLGLGYGYRPDIHRAAGVAYAPEFSHYHKETDQRFLIEVLGEASAQTNAARDAFWKSERSANAHLVQFAEADCLDPDAVLERVAQELTNRGIIANPMSDDELWLLLRDDVIRDFTKAVRGFVSRCQKELISPDRLDGMLPDADPELWSIIWRRNQSVRQINVPGLQVRFWRLCSEIYKRYRQVLAESHQTDFDQLMLNAAEMIRDGRTGFKSARGNGDICQIRHLLIDEFQDFSHLFDELRKAIVARSPEANFFCVGDDWQAINKFAGSNLRYFTGFHETFEPSVRKLITRNYRSCRRIVEIGNQVMNGQGEPSISNSKEQGNVWRVEVGGCGNLTEAEEAVVEELGDDALAILRIASDCTSRGETVAVLSRTNSVSTPEGMHKLGRWQDKLRSFLPEKDRVILDVSTTHGYKGKEADTVILLDPEAYPFVHSDSIFATIFGDTLDSIKNDERRLFYVGVTRPRKTLFLLSYPARHQEPRPYDILFLKGHYPPAFDINRLQSNLLCGSRIVLRLTNRNRYSQSGGTFPLKDRLRAQEYKWNEDTKVWSKFLEQGSINSPFECVQYLNAQPWVRDADDIVATFAWEDQKHGFRIERGQVLPDTAESTHAGSAFMGGPKPPFPIQEPPAVAQNHGRPPTADASNPSCNGKFETNVVGMRYEGRNQNASDLKAGDELFLRREPLNRYDRNAIEVLTSEGVQIGFISRNVAFYIAGALDEQGGIWIARVASIWKLPPPQFVGSLQISFELPPGVSIPADFDSFIQVEDNPFASTRPSSAPQAERVSHAAPPPSRTSDKPQLSPQPPDTEQIPWGKAQAPPAVSGSLTQAQEAGLAHLGDHRLRAIIAELYRAGACRWPVIGYKGRSPTEHSTDSILEVAWPDQKIGIYLPTYDVTSFAAQGWVILPATAVSVDMLRSILSNAISTPSEVPRSQAQVDPASVSASQSDSCERMDRANLEALTPKQREELENLLEPRLAPIIAEMYLSGCSDWPEIGYEGKDAKGLCTGSMLEVAWLDFKIGIALPANEFRSLAEAGWTILPAAAVTASELRSLFSAEMTGARPADQSGTTTPSIDASAADSKEFTDANIHVRHGQFYDEVPDEDIPPF